MKIGVGWGYQPVGGHSDGALLARASLEPCASCGHLTGPQHKYTVT